MWRNLMEKWGITLPALPLLMQAASDISLASARIFFIYSWFCLLIVWCPADQQGANRQNMSYHKTHAKGEAMLVR